MPARLTGSGMARGHACPAAYALPIVRSLQSIYEARGSARHQYLQLIADGMPSLDALDLIDSAHRTECAGIDIRQVPRSGETEVPMAFNVRTSAARKLKCVDRRDYDQAGEDEIPGTADLIVWGGVGMELDCPVVIDWKGSTYSTDPVQVDAQLDLYGLMAARIQGVENVGVWAGMVNNDGSIGWRKRRLSWEDLDAISTRARATVAAIENARSAAPGIVPDVATGAHCRHCPAFLACPATKVAVSLVLDGATDATVGAAYAASRVVLRLVKEVERVTRDYVSANGRTPIDEGREVLLDTRGALRIATKKEG
jgi:hypothetical protein